MVFRVLLVEPEDVLYTLPNNYTYLQAFLESIGINPRHQRTVERAMKAAQFDVFHGRIRRTDYYDAILRFHGVTNPNDLPAGREALWGDRTNFQVTIGAIAGMEALHKAGLHLGLVLNTEHSGEELIELLAQNGFPRNLWAVVATSCEIGQIIPDPSIFEAILNVVKCPPKQVMFLTRKINIVPLVSQLGLQGVGFRPTEATTVPRVFSFGELVDLLTT